MYSINRSAIKIKPKQPFVDWINTNGEDKVTPQQLSGDSPIILLREFFKESDEEKCLKSKYEEIFFHQLWAWCTDEAVWPESRNWRLFQEWFEIEVSSEVFDMEEEKIEREEV